MTGPPIYTANETGQIREVESKKSRLEIHELAGNGLPLCGNTPAPAKLLAKLGQGFVTCGSCAGFTGH